MVPNFSFIGMYCIDQNIVALLGRKQTAGHFPQEHYRWYDRLNFSMNIQMEHWGGGVIRKRQFACGVGIHAFVTRSSICKEVQAFNLRSFMVVYKKGCCVTGSTDP